MNQELIKQYQPPEWRVEKHKLKKCFYKACWFVLLLDLLRTPTTNAAAAVRSPGSGSVTESWSEPKKKESKLLGSLRRNLWQIEIEERICLIAWWTRTCPSKIETFWWEWFDFIHSYALRKCLRDATTVQPEVFHGTRLSCLYLRQSFGKVDFQPSLFPFVSANEISVILLKKTQESQPTNIESFSCRCQAITQITRPGCAEMPCPSRAVVAPLKDDGIKPLPSSNKCEPTETSCACNSYGKQL